MRPENPPLLNESPKEVPDIQSIIPERVKMADRELFARCCRYMELRKPFLVESFSLDDLAMAMFTNKLYLSQTIKILCYFLIVCVIIYIKLKSNDYLSMT